jgi:hypothetical protein
MPTPIWRIQVQKQFLNQNWSNDYLTSAITIEDATDVANAVIAFERAIHAVSVEFLYVRISSVTVGDRYHRDITLNEPGLRDTGGSDALPLFNTIRVDFGTSFYDPGRKYYRSPVVESDQSGGSLLPGTISFINGAIAAHLPTDVLNEIVTPKGHQVTDASCYQYVQMRQQHRRRKKKVTP